MPRPKKASEVDQEAIKRKLTKSRTADTDDDTIDSDNDDNLSQAESISADLQQHKADEMIRYLIISHQSQKPISRTDIVKNCLGNDHKNLYNKVFQLAKKKLRAIFGFEILEPESKRGYYYLSNGLRLTDFTAPTKLQSATDGLLYFVLSNIFMRNPAEKVIDEEDFHGFLSKLGVGLIDNHPIFGDTKKLITKTFADQGWLEIRQQPGARDPDVKETFYGWGWRAYLVVSRGDLLDFATGIFSRPGSQWNDHREIAEAEDNLEADRENAAAIPAPKKKGRKNKNDED